MILMLKRLAGMLMATVVWSWRDLKDNAMDSLLDLLRDLLVFVVAVVLFPLAVCENVAEAWKLRKFITKETHWIKHRATPPAETAPKGKP